MPPMKADGAIHHQQLPVVAHVEERHAPGQPGVQETGGGDPAVAQAIKDFGIKIADADTVQQHADLDAARLGRDQRIGESLVPPRHRGKHKTSWRWSVWRRDRGQHLRIGGVAAFQHGQGVAIGQGAAGDARAGFAQLANLRRGVRQAGRGRQAGLGIAQPAHFQGPPRHPVDPEQVIDQPAQKRREPGRADPAQRAAHIAFLEQNVHRHRAGDQDVQGSDQGDQGGGGHGKHLARHRFCDYRWRA